MRKIISFLVMAGLLSWQVPAIAGYRMTPRQAFYYHAHKGNLSALQKLKSMGYSVNMNDQYGNSALCKSVYQQDYSAFAMLKQVGATTAHPCVEKIPAEKIKAFNEGYTTWLRNQKSNKAKSDSLFNTIYELASDEEVEKLKEMRATGANLDTLNEQKNTPYCQALIDKNCPAYETLKELNVNVNHCCVRRLDQDQQKLDCDKSTLWWWVGGGAAVGTAAIVAIAAGGGGGGSAENVVGQYALCVNEPAV